MEDSTATISEPPVQPAKSVQSQARDFEPIFGFILLGGSLSGALVRDVRLANEIAKRGYKVHVWWAMDRQKSAGLRPEIEQHWLFHGLRYWGWPGRGLIEWLGRGLNLWFGDKARAHGAQRRPYVVRRIMENLTRAICKGIENDAAIIARFARDLDCTGVTHVLPMLEFLGLFVAAARSKIHHPLRYLVTFQGYELYSAFARSINLERDLYARLVHAVDQSDWPAIAVSEDYLQRVIEDIGVNSKKLRAIPPGVPTAQPMDLAKAQRIVASKFLEYRAEIPLISYVGRRDVEKGIDLLLYAARILIQRGCKFQLAICGPTLWGDQYGQLCQRIAEDLRLGGTVMWRRFVPDEVRTALFSLSHCIVYPSIHREPFGMVAAEAIAHGTPAIVPDYGGVASAIEAHGEVAGVRFKAWDSGDLADQIERLLKDRALHAKLSKAGPRVAEYFSIENLADRILEHVGVGQAD